MGRGVHYLIKDIMATTERVLIATIGKPHGLRGDVTVRLATDEPERRFAAGTPVFLEQRPATVRGSRWNGAILLVSFDGVTDRTQAEALRGIHVWADVPVDELPAEDDVFYDRQLVGLAVRNAVGTTVGVVTEVLHLPGQDLLAVDVDGTERLVPFVEALVPTVNLAEGFVQVAEVAGLLDDEES